MTWPTPQPGLVIRYSYLWTTEAETGQEEGLKERPCAIVLAVATELNRTRVIVLPITHTMPQPPDEGFELTSLTKARLGLDGERSWIVLDEGNDFVWPGPDLRPTPGAGPESVAYGFLPPRLFKTIRDRFLARLEAKEAATVTRTE